MKKYFICLGLIFSSVILSAAKAQSLPPLETVPYVDLNRYLGKWYEIASFPQSFQKDCVATTAEYSLKKKNKIRVINECRLKTLDGRLKRAKGSAKVVDEETNSKLKVTFFWPFYGDYWIIELGSNYEYAVVGHPSREYLWILSREPVISEVKYQEILKTLEEKHHYDLSILRKTLQPSG